MYKILEFIEFIFGNFISLIFINSIFLLIKIHILKILFSQKINSFPLKTARFYLFIILIGGLFEDLAWISIALREFFQFSPHSIIFVILRFLTRISWLFFVFEYLFLTFFLETLIEPFSKNKLKNICFSIITFFFSLCFIYSSITSFYLPKPTWIQLAAESLFIIVGIFAFIIPTLILCINKLKNSNRPKILKKQFKILVQYIIIPRILFDFFQYYPFRMFDHFFTNYYSIVGFSTVLLTWALYFCARRIMGLRFLNFYSHIQENRRYNFMHDFKETLENLGKANTIQELRHISYSFFKSAFEIPASRIGFFVREQTNKDYKAAIVTQSEIQTERLLSEDQNLFIDYLQKHKIVIYDEIEFNHFYNPNHLEERLLLFLQELQADIFLPIYKNQTVIGYIMVERSARKKEFYSEIERDEMIIFASYLGNIINLLQNRNLDMLIYQEKELREELYKKHQEITQYKESMYSFLRNTKQKDIGIIFYKQKNFIFANQAAKEILKINPNNNPGAAISKFLKTIGEQVQHYRNCQTALTKTIDGQKIAVTGVPDNDRNQVILTVSYPDFSDVMSAQINQLKDPSNWDYLLYLETTGPGQLINSLLPGNVGPLLEFKIHLLQAALSKKALLLEMPTHDIMPTVELLHHISMRTMLHIIDLQTPTQHAEMALKLFGANSLLQNNNQDFKPLLEKLHGNGTLFIQNIELLDLDTQEYLAEFIKYGYFHLYKSNQRVHSSVRIICSTNQNLTLLTQNGSFSRNLLQELKKLHIEFPSLLTLPEPDLIELINGFAQEAVKQTDFQNLLELTSKDKHKIIQSKPTSLHELKIKVQHLLIQKSKEHKIEHEVQIDQIGEVSDPELIHAARLGKHALRDPKIMTLLWNKFKNQNKIAAFLNVNRSSVNRRCKEYNLI